MPRPSERAFINAAELKLLREVKKGAPITAARLDALQRVLGKAPLLADRIGLHNAQRSAYLRAIAAVALQSKRPINKWRKSDWMLAAEYGSLVKPPTLRHG